MRYFFLKMAAGNSYAVPMLRGTLGGSPAALGFLRGRTLSELQEYHDQEIGRSPGQVFDLYRWAIGETPGYAITVAEGRFFVLAVAGPVYEFDRERFIALIGDTPHDDDTILVVPVTVEVEERLAEVPTMLAQINANRRLSSSTFKEIDGNEYGTLSAIDHVLFRAGILSGYPHLENETKDLAHLMMCLSHSEQIELVSRAIESLGLHVSAPTGGFVKNIDIFVRNDHIHPIERGSFSVPGRRAFRPGTVGIQIRTPSPRFDTEIPEGVEYVVATAVVPEDPEVERNPQILDLLWVESVLAEAPDARAWLERVVRWVPYAGRVIRRLAAGADRENSE